MYLPMLFTRYSVACLIGLALASSALQAAQTVIPSPSPGANPAGASATVIPSAPVTSPAAVNSLPVSAPIAPAQSSTPAVPPVATSAAPLGTPLPEGSETEKSVVQIIN